MRPLDWFWERSSHFSPIGLQSNKFYLIKLDRETYDAPNLKKILSNSNTEFIMHYARQDLMWLKYHFKVEPKNIFVLNFVLKLQGQHQIFMDIKI